MLLSYHCILNIIVIMYYLHGQQVFTGDTEVLSNIYICTNIYFCMCIYIYQMLLIPKHCPSNKFLWVFIDNLLLYVEIS